MLALERHQVPPHLVMDGHGHAHPHLVIIASGTVDEEQGRHIQSLKSCGARLSRAHAAHSLAFGGDGADCIIVEAASGFWARIFARALRHNDNLFASLSPAEVQTLARIGSPERLASRPKDLLTFGRALASFSTPASAAPSWFDEAVAHLDCGASASVTATRLRRHRTHFARSFAAHAGLLPSEYRALRRAAAAAATVRETDARLCEVALEHGFAHQSHMTNAFRVLFGLAPARLRWDASFLQDGLAADEPIVAQEETP